MLHTARLPHVPSTLVQAGEELVISFVYHKPPVTPAAHSFLFEESFGSNIIALVLPPIVFGPLSFQLTSESLLLYIKLERFCSAKSIASSILSVGIVLVTGSYIIK